MRVVDLESVNHENICCLNTAIIIFIFGRRRGLLAQLIKKIDELEEARPPLQLKQNFRRNLWFWTAYYTHRGRDRLSLEFSSHIHFEEWELVVACLCADDGSPHALLPSSIPLPVSPYRKRANGASRS